MFKNQEIKETLEGRKVLRHYEQDIKIELTSQKIMMTKILQM